MAKVTLVNVLRIEKQGLVSRAIETTSNWYSIILMESTLITVGMSKPPR